MSPAGGKCPRYGTEIGITFQESGAHSLGLGQERGRVASGYGKAIVRKLALGSRFSGLLNGFKDNVSIRAAEAERAYACQPTPITRCPVLRLGWNDYSGIVPVDFWIALLVMQVWGDHPVMQSQRCLYDAGYACCTFQVTKICFCRTNDEWLIRIAPQCQSR
ncbi:hypothetical protein HOC_15532 [Hyphomonas oceanitis SCH89]|uniref:Uncharacterized protein n=1 Tax=Hyphomonas oceanitis SCH89 TaxID=1280953 RepID=A0A059G4P9_9PROT|nr:hypothetical protein HOC_15532 [Hyphomonas oceanitis SCH89]